MAHSYAWKVVTFLDVELFIGPFMCILIMVAGFLWNKQLGKQGGRPSDFYDLTLEVIPTTWNGLVTQISPTQHGRELYKGVNIRS